MKKCFCVMALAASLALLLSGCGEAKEAYEKGMALAMGGKYEKSLPYFEKAIKEKKEQTEYYIGYGMALNRLNRYGQAISSSIMGWQFPNMALANMVLWRSTVGRPFPLNILTIWTVISCIQG